MTSFRFRGLSSVVPLKYPCGLSLRTIKWTPFNNKRQNVFSKNWYKCIEKILLTEIFFNLFFIFFSVGSRARLQLTVALDEVPKKIWF